MPIVIGRVAATGQLKLSLSDGSTALARWNGNSEPAIGSSVRYDAESRTANSKVAISGGNVPRPLSRWEQPYFTLEKDKNDADYAGGEIWDIDKPQKRSLLTSYRSSGQYAKWYRELDPLALPNTLPDLSAGLETEVARSPSQPALPAAEVDWQLVLDSSEAVAKCRFEDSIDVGGTNPQGDGGVYAVRVQGSSLQLTKLVLKGRVETKNNGWDGVCVGVLRSEDATLRETELAVQSAVLAFTNSLFVDPVTGQPSAVGSTGTLPFERFFMFKTFEALPPSAPFGMQDYTYELSAEQLPIVQDGQCLVIVAHTLDEQFHQGGYWSVEEIEWA